MGITCFLYFFSSPFFVSTENRSFSRFSTIIIVIIPAKHHPRPRVDIRSIRDSPPLGMTTSRSTTTTPTTTRRAVAWRRAAAVLAVDIHLVLTTPKEEDHILSTPSHPPQLSCPTDRTNSIITGIASTIREQQRQLMVASRTSWTGGRVCRGETTTITIIIILAITVAARETQQIPRLGLVTGLSRTAITVT